jgi:type VI secretion system secreted protein VgrG
MYGFSKLFNSPSFNLNQENRFIFIDPGCLNLKQGDIGVRSIRGSEAFSIPFKYTLNCILKNKLDPQSIMGKPVSLKIRSENKNFPERFLTGYVTYVDKIYESNNHYEIYEIKIESWLSLLDKNSNSRVFSNKTISQIIEKIISEHSKIPKIKVSYIGDCKNKTIKTCVQYNESDSHFISRIIEENGYFYMFEHTPENLILNICSHEGAYVPLKSSNKTSVNSLQFVIDKNSMTEVKAETATFSNYNAHYHDNISTAEKVVLSKRNPGESNSLNIFKHHETNDAQGAPREEIEHMKAVINLVENHWTGHSDNLNFAPGKIITTRNATKTQENKSFAITGIHISIFDGYYLTESETQASLEFSCIESNTKFKSCYYSKPKADGLHRATVVGTNPGTVESNDNHTVNVRFHWDRYATQSPSENKFPVTVSQMWAGKDHGAVYLPHVDDEVFISFLDGNLEQPVIVGSAFSAKNAPKVSKGVSPTIHALYTAGSNQILFDDKKGSERFELHAQKDFTLKTNDETLLKQKNLNITAQEKVEISVGSIKVTVDKTGMVNIGEAIKIQVTPAGATISSTTPIQIDSPVIFSKPIIAPNVK